VAFWLSLVEIGFMILGMVAQALQLVVSIHRRDRSRNVTGDPWDGRSLERSTPSPALVFSRSRVDGRAMSSARTRGAADRGIVRGDQTRISCG
jgi:heme/copper-type cytochrome/quinol oxidase subunit 1